ncbi:ATP-dependent protease [Sulfurifustis variabilis]|uniref:endopeptidase La n=1 Tax=Sulfurifustis variabilis TaxID=1675686 RepID=A0A1B4VDN5_9GAMM|nr:ATP-binding protein [Sulfurifustis variabilis]BAU48417.1 ATP-dependent protease [Sulfurifustis variabilis]
MAKGGTPAIPPLEAEKLYTRCDPAQLDFETTAGLKPLDTILGQPRALEALRFGIGIRRPGYHLYALGPPGAGKRTLVRLILDERAAREPASLDLCYVNNFDAPHRPRLLRLPTGVGERLRRDVDRLLEDVRGAIPAVFETDEYRARRREIEESLKEQQQRAFEELGREADSHGIALIRTPAGMAFAPMRKGEVVGAEEFQALPGEEQERLQAVIASLEERLERLMQQIHQWRREGQQRIRQLDREVATSAVRHAIDELRKGYASLAQVLEHLDRLEQAMVENFEDFRRGEEGPETPSGLPMTGGGAPLRRYRVNVLVDRSGVAGAPVVHEDHPTYHNLLGRIEHVAQMGALVTDFALIKAGALHRADGGYLLLDARKLLMQPFAWEGLKRALDTREIRIESLGQVLSLISTVSLEPEPAPLDVKVVLLGDRLLYYLLYQYDPDFAELFKVAADFEDDMARDDQAQLGYARLIAGLVLKEKLLPFDRGAVARTVEHAARLADDASKLSLRVRELADLLREADYWAREAGRGTVTVEDIARAIDAKVYRLDRVRSLVQEQIERRLLLIETRGSRVGQVNGLSLARLGDFAFGHPVRISARVRLGKGDVLDIQREVELGGPIHSKGVLILSGLLGGRYVLDRPLSMSASLVFEQTYGEVEGDSASCAELYALLSALADVPLRQSLAVTGSIDQHGEVQAIGGVNEKIEGFFDACRRRGLTGEQGVLIPAANVQHLMLRADVVEAAAQGRFHVYAVNHVDEGLALLTGRPAGERGPDGRFPDGSVNFLVEAKLRAMAEQARAFFAPGPGDDPDPSRARR